MSRLTEMVATSQRLSILAMEEASRFGLRTADIDHMLLALTVNEQIAGQVLRSVGLTLESAREAAAEQRSAHLAELGVVTDAPEQGSIATHKTGGYEWSDRALTVLTRAGKRGKRGDAAAVLRELVSEPSGLIRELLLRLESSPEIVLAGLDQAERIPTHSSTRTRARHSGSTAAFVPASVSEVWTMLADPLSMPGWDQSVGSIEAAPTPQALRLGDRWEGRARTQWPNGKTLQVKPRLRRRGIELREFEPRSRIAWRMTFPDAKAANARYVAITLESAAAGTQIIVALHWEADSDRPRNSFMRTIVRPVVQILMKPFEAFSIWMQVSQIADGIGRVFR